MSEQIITPNTVIASSAINYDKIIIQFGATKIKQELIEL